MEGKKTVPSKVRIAEGEEKVTSNAKLRLVYDVFSVTYFSILWTMMFLDCGPNYFSFFYYLTNWGCTSTLIFYFIATLVDYERLMKVNVSTKLIHSCTFVRELSVSLQSVIVPFFWIIVYPQERWRSITWEVQMHGMGLIFICIDYLIRVSNFSSLSSKNLFMVVLSYLALNYFVVNKLETMIYPGITYNTVESWLVVILAIALVLTAHQLASIITICLVVKNKIWRKYEKDDFVSKSIKIVQKAQKLRNKDGIRKRLGSIFVG
ncbi:multi-pass transmembrane [Cryptosporidium sp. chipmunk genotype I]|uniref:multi-pass transmembrane n=1 Tax=Cryptosporidium sp. chipmunk genotype I TaxID=1280935 RepID=UPI003519F17C|nr:multi-pass transmembrane [Cryptosporidium sp. chipmunk genotype I]